MYNVSFKYHGSKTADPRAYPWIRTNTIADKYGKKRKMLNEDVAYSMADRKRETTKSMTDKTNGMRIESVRNIGLGLGQGTKSTQFYKKQRLIGEVPMDTEVKVWTPPAGFYIPRPPAYPRRRGPERVPVPIPAPPPFLEEVKEAEANAEIVAEIAEGLGLTDNTIVAAGGSDGVGESKGEDAADGGESASGGYGGGILNSAASLLYRGAASLTGLFTSKEDKESIERAAMNYIDKKRSEKQNMETPDIGQMVEAEKSDKVAVAVEQSGTIPLLAIRSHDQDVTLGKPKVAKTVRFGFNETHLVDTRASLQQWYDEATGIGSSGMIGKDGTRPILPPLLPLQSTMDASTPYVSPQVVPPSQVKAEVQAAPAPQPPLYAPYRSPLGSVKEYVLAQEASKLKAALPALPTVEAVKRMTKLIKRSLSNRNPKPGLDQGARGERGGPDITLGWSNRRGVESVFPRPRPSFAFETAGGYLAPVREHDRDHAPFRLYSRSRFEPLKKDMRKYMDPGGRPIRLRTPVAVATSPPVAPRPIEQLMTPSPVADAKTIDTLGRESSTMPKHVRQQLLVQQGLTGSNYGKTGPVDATMEDLSPWSQNLRNLEKGVDRAIAGADAYLKRTEKVLEEVNAYQRKETPEEIREIMERWAKNAEPKSGREKRKGGPTTAKRALNELRDSPGYAAAAHRTGKGVPVDFEPFRPAVSGTGRQSARLQEQGRLNYSQQNMQRNETNVAARAQPRENY